MSPCNSFHFYFYFNAIVFTLPCCVAQHRHREAAGRGDPWLTRHGHGLPRFARNDAEVSCELCKSQYLRIEMEMELGPDFLATHFLIAAYARPSCDNGTFHSKTGRHRRNTSVPAPAQSGCAHAGVSRGPLHGSGRQIPLRHGRRQSAGANAVPAPAISRRGRA